MIEKDFIDRVPQYPGQVKIIPVEGKPNYYTMQRADFPLKEGTPMNKSTFDSMTKSRLTGRYYELAVTHTETDTEYGGTSYGTKYENAFTAEGMPSQWDKGQRITVYVPVMDDITVISNTLMGIVCNTILQSGKRYELCYNGTSFDAMEV